MDQVIPRGSLFIVNNSRVIASRLHGNLNTGARIEILLLEPSLDAEPGSNQWLCIGKPMKKLRVGSQIAFSDNLNAVVIKLADEPSSGPMPFLIKFNLSCDELLTWLDRQGEMPLPPYISRKDADPDQHNRDRKNYQTVYSKDLGSVAAPTAGLHFTEALMRRLQNLNCEFAHVTLHIGAGTFLPVKTQDPKLHTMHSERFLVPRQTLEAISKAHKNSRPVIVVGTTAFRSLEGLAHIAAQRKCSLDDLADQWLRTDIFIRPNLFTDRFRPWAAHYLMTNFHQPESTLFMLICALVGFEKAHYIYSDAVNQGYRLFSYGDSSLLSVR